MAGTGEFSLASNMSRNTTAYFETHHPMTSFTNVRSCRRFEGKGAMRWLFWVTPVMFVLGAVRYATREEDTPSFLAAAFMVAIAGGLGLSLNVAALYRSTRRAEERAAAAAAAASAAAVAAVLCPAVPAVPAVSAVSDGRPAAAAAATTSSSSVPVPVSERAARVFRCIFICSCASVGGM